MSAIAACSASAAAVSAQRLRHAVVSVELPLQLLVRPAPRRARRPVLAAPPGADTAAAADALLAQIQLMSSQPLGLPTNRGLAPVRRGCCRRASAR